ncbi:hypothetical protein D9M71_317730 [compost metagenome]
MGELIQPLPNTKWGLIPRYVAGFWFPDFSVAVEKLNKPYAVLQARVKKGSMEEKNRHGTRKGVDNNMFGIDPKDHPSSISVIIFNIEYDSIKQATEATGYSKYIINKRIKENHPDFQYK